LLHENRGPENREFFPVFALYEPGPSIKIRVKKVFPAYLPRQKKRMSKKLRTGIVGFGISAKVFHAPFIANSDQYELVAVVERHKEESKKIYPHVNVVRDIRDLLQDPGIDLVVITTPNETHFPYAKAALEAGKHVVLEKPFTNTSAEAMELVDLSASVPTVLSVYQNNSCWVIYIHLRATTTAIVPKPVHMPGGKRHCPAAASCTISALT
jgi:hypothetical protein